MENNTTRFTIYPSKGLLERLKVIAKRHKRSANSEILLIIEEYVTREERKSQNGNQSL